MSLVSPTKNVFNFSVPSNTGIEVPPSLFKNWYAPLPSSVPIKFSLVLKEYVTSSTDAVKVVPLGSWIVVGLLPPVTRTERFKPACEEVNERGTYPKPSASATTELLNCAVFYKWFI